MSVISTEFSQQFPILSEKLSYLFSNEFMDEKTTKRQMKKALSDDEDDKEEAIRCILDTYTLKWVKPKKSVLTAEQIEEAKQKRLMDYIESLPILEKGETKKFSDSLSEFNIPKELHTSVSVKAKKIGIEIILKELEKLSSNVKTKTSILRKDGTMGAAVSLYFNCAKYKYHPDGTPYEISVIDIKGNKINGVILDIKDEENKGEKYTFEGYDDTDEYCSLEKVGGKKTDEEGRSQYRKKPMTFKKPDWSGEEYCKSVVENKKFNQHLHIENGGDWDRVKLKNPPIFCCNRKLVGDATACPTHAKKAMVDWTSCGEGWTSKKVE